MSQNLRSRRKFLKEAAQALGTLGLSPAIANFVMQSIGSTAQAATQSFSDKIYLFFCFPGGPPRWFFDLPLTPNGSTTKYTDAFSHAALGTYVGVTSGKSEVVYKPWYDSSSKKWLPPVWGSNPAGGAFTHALSNTLFVRGLDLEVNNHAISRYRNQSPIIGGYSIAGVLAQKTNTPIPGISSGSIANAFKSEKPLSPTELNLTVTATTNPIKNIMSYFAGSVAQENLVFQNAFDKFDSYAEKQGLFQQGLKEARERSDALVTLGVAAFNDKWPEVFARYSAKVSEALSQNNVEKILDINKALPVPPDISGASDLRNQYDQNKFLNTNLDLRQLISSTANVPNLAALFASIEILITMGVSQIATVDISELTGLQIDASGTKVNLRNDQHFVGTMASTIGTSFLYRSVLSCTNELISVLKDKALFNKTVIQFGAEFSRNARANGSGSDHGFLGSSALIMSGMIDKTSVIGNIKADTSSTYLGHWGLAALHASSSNEYPIRINDVSKTVCGLLGTRNVSNNGVYLLKNTGTLWTSFTDANGEAKNVA